MQGQVHTVQLQTVTGQHVLIPLTKQDAWNIYSAINQAETQAGKPAQKVVPSQGCIFPGCPHAPSKGHQGCGKLHSNFGAKFANNGLVVPYGWFNDANGIKTKCVILTVENRHHKWAAGLANLPIGGRKGPHGAAANLATAAEEATEELFVHFINKCDKGLFDGVVKATKALLGMRKNASKQYTTDLGMDLWGVDVKAYLQDIAEWSVTNKNPVWGKLSQRKELRGNPSGRGWVENMETNKRMGLPHECFEKVELVLIPVENILASHTTPGKNYVRINDLYGRTVKVSDFAVDTVIVANHHRII